MTFVYLTAEDVLTIAELAVDDQQVVVREAGLLESAVHRPAASMFGQEVYPDLVDKAAALLQSLVIGHPLLDGNKRMAWIACVTFLSVNGTELRPDIDAAEKLVVGVATGEFQEVPDIAERLRSLQA